MENQGFHKFNLLLENNLFQTLSNSVDFEDFNKGRKGNHLVEPNEQGIPIVRTTTRFGKPAHCFGPIHHRIITNIKQAVEQSDTFRPTSLHFNNALIEVYGQEYRKMGYHSDLALDLAEGSFIALYSCYKHPIQSHLQYRKLNIKNKSTQEEFELLLENNTVVLFSLSTNAQFSHKIIPAVPSQQPSKNLENEWLGITFRQSKTYIQFKEETPHFANGEILQLADETQQKTFFQLRGEENKSIGYCYPNLTFTLSKADLMRPKPSH
jgi:hypothetical protein